MWDVKSEDGREGVVGQAGEGGQRRGKKSVCASSSFTFSFFCLSSCVVSKKLKC